MNKMTQIYQEQSGILETHSERQIGLFIHLSTLANLILIPAGYVIPIVLWQSNKDQMPALDVHGKDAVNWMITSILLHLVNVVLFVIGIIVVGFFIIPLNMLIFATVGIAGIAFSIIAGIQANEGKHWEYPLNIRFLK